MKKMILLLVLPFTILMAIDFTMTEKGLFAETTTQDPAPAPTPGTVTGETNPYLEPVNLPECDASNPEVQFIRNNADWKTINSSSKRIFCVSPGDYRSLGYVMVKTSGTAQKRRYIVLNNGNDLHPGQLSASQRANYKIKFYNANYWTIDRQSAVGSVSRGIDFHDGSSFNIVNRMFTGDDIGVSVTIRQNCNNNTIQNSRFTEQKSPSDMIAINLIDYDVITFIAKNNKIINNEFVNQNDGVQISRAPRPGEPSIGGLRQNVNVEGTIIDSNIFYLKPGTRDMENAIDMKAGTDNASNPVIITNNKMWGYNQERGAGDSAMVCHYSTKNIKINNNVFFNNKQAFGSGANGTNPTFRLGIINGEMTGNLFYNCGETSGYYPVLRLGSSLNMKVHNNIIIDGEYMYGKFSNLSNGTAFSNNIIVDTTTQYSKVNCDTIFLNSLSTTKTEPRSLYSRDLVFTYDNFTNDPRTMILENALKP